MSINLTIIPALAPALGMPMSASASCHVLDVRTRVVGRAGAARAATYVKAFLGSHAWSPPV